MSSQSQPHPRTRYYGVAFLASEQRRIAVPPEGQVVPVGFVLSTPRGVALGPLELQPPKQSTLGLTRLEYLEESEGIAESLFSSVFGGSGIGLATAAAVPAAGHDVDLTRRDVLKLGAVAAGGLALADTATAKKQALDVAEFEVEQNPGLTLTLTDRVAQVLPSDQTYRVYNDGEKIGSFKSDGEVTVPAGTTGEFRVATENADTLDFLNSVSDIFEDKTNTYTLTLPKSAAQYKEGATAAVTSTASITEQVSGGGPDATVLEIGGTSIPHKSEEDGHRAGQYYVDGSNVVFEAGPEPPPSRDVTLKTYAGSIDERLDDLFRGSSTISPFNNE